MPDGDLGAIIKQAVTEKLERLLARRFARTKSPRKGLRETDTSPSSRRIAAAVRRAVSERDGNRCRYVDKQGRRCSARDRLEFHLGGDHSPRQICPMCRVHNRYLAEHDYGKAAMSQYRRPRNGAAEAAAYSTGRTTVTPVRANPGVLPRVL